ncbi:MAG: ISL3 family transposase, partial [Proteobacteria bacterium]|nr:ISL3 family transposase [Pseudomonadota bacterium]
MSTSILYHGFGIRGYEYVRTRYEGGTIEFTVRQDPKSLRCSCCGSRHVIRRGEKQRRFRSLPIGAKSVWTLLAVPRVECLICGVVRQVKINFANPKRRFTKAFERYVLELSRRMTIKDAADHLGVGWDMVKDIQKRNLYRRFSKPKLGKLKLIAIDEICIGKGLKFITLVLDLKTGAVVFVGDGKGAAALDPFWRRLRRFKTKIKAVAMDMSPAYFSAVTKNLPEAQIVFDHFHIIKLFNEKLGKFRRSIYNHLKKEKDQSQDLIKCTRWLLLKNSGNLDLDKKDADRLKEALGINKPLSTVYYMKEDLRQLWSQPNKQKAEAFFDDW